MIPSYLHDLALPNVFAQYTKQVESYLLESTKNGSSDKVRGIPTQIYQRYMIDFP